MNIYDIRIVTKTLQENPKRIIIGEFKGKIKAESKKYISDHIKDIYKSLEIDPKTVEYIEIEEEE